MRPTDTPTDADLAALVTGQLSEARHKEIERWAAADPANAARLDQVRLLLVPTQNGAAVSWNRERIWGPVGRAIEQANAAPTMPVSVPAPVAPSPAAVPARRWGWVGRHGIAAAAMIIVALGGLLVLTRPPWNSAASGSSVAREYSTGRGEHTTIQLADGSRITLAPESHLRILPGFGAPERQVRLEGEAAFQVVHDSAHRFSVRAGNALVEDIGTRFDVRAYAADSDTRVAVAEGAVTIAPDSSRHATDGSNVPRPAEGVLVRGGEVARLDHAGHASTTRIENDEVYFAWTDGRLVFARQPLRDVVATLARWLDAKVVIRDSSLGNRLVTASFSPDSAQDVVRALARAVDASVVTAGHTLTLVPR